MKKKVKKEETKVINITQRTEFQLAHQHNVERLMFALTMCGFFVKVHNREPHFTVEVYQYHYEDAPKPKPNKK